MAYEFVKLSDVTLTEFATDPNLLIEEGGEIKRISAANVATPQVKADWNEEDPNSAAFILNKPEVGGGGANVVTYTVVSGALQLDGVTTTAQAVIDEWNNGSILRIATTAPSDTGGDVSSVVNISYTIASGAASGTLYYYSGTSISSVSI